MGPFFNAGFFVPKWNWAVVIHPILNPFRTPSPLYHSSPVSAYIGPSLGRESPFTTQIDNPPSIYIGRSCASRTFQVFRLSVATTFGRRTIRVRRSIRSDVTSFDAFCSREAIYSSLHQSQRLLVWAAVFQPWCPRARSTLTNYIGTSSSLDQRESVEP